MISLRRRLVEAMCTFPGRRAWLEFAVVACIVAGVAAPLGLATGLLHWAPRPPGRIALTAVIVLFIPALGEELLFRGPWIPSQAEASRALLPILITTTVFTLWHVVETLWQPAHRALFTRPDFLVWAAWLGLWCAILRHRSGSIWPGVALHWATVVGWIGWLGGPGF